MGKNNTKVPEKEKEKETEKEKEKEKETKNKRKGRLKPDRRSYFVPNEVQNMM